MELEWLAGWPGRQADMPDAASGIGCQIWFLVLEFLAGVDVAVDWRVAEPQSGVMKWPGASGRGHVVRNDRRDHG